MTPSNFGKIGAIGIELWTMTNGIQFDNIFVGHNANDAKKFADETWALKAKIENVAEKDTEKEADKPSGLGALDKVQQLFDTLKLQSLEFVTRVQESPVDAFKEMPHIPLLFAVVGLLPILLLSVFASSKAQTEDAEEEEEEDNHGEDVEEEDNQDEDAEEEEEEEEEVEPSAKATGKFEAKADQTPSKRKTATPKKE
ncbi:hypothetical protein BASA84_000781 [Batrachochytrium salamandrivorans]|nr:hypothetical protein BASA84_000781 [Batrachochytrium salamandrivorans]